MKPIMMAGIFVLCVGVIIAVLFATGVLGKKKDDTQTRSSNTPTPSSNTPTPSSNTPTPSSNTPTPSTGGTTRVQLCNPWVARNCERAGAVMTCPEFKACRMQHNQQPCAGDEWYKLCGYGDS
jgi:cytoskeletal protein RodZ